MANALIYPPTDHNNERVNSVKIQLCQLGAHVGKVGNVAK